LERDNQSLIPTLSAKELVERFSVQDRYWDQAMFEDFNQFGFHRLEHTQHLMIEALPPHRKNFHDFFFITKGVLHRGRGVDSYEVRPHTFCFIPAHQITYAALTSSDVEGFACHFTDKLLAGMQETTLQKLDFLHLDGQPLVEVPAHHTPTLIYLLERIEAEFIQDLENKYELIAAYLQTLFLELTRFIAPRSHKAAKSNETITARYKQLLAQHIQTTQSIQDYAEMLGITPNHLNKCVKQVTSRTARDWIQEVILLESKVLLAQTTLPIAEISFRLGITDQSYFGRFFKKKTGHTPSQYRKMIEMSGFLPEPS